MNESIPTLLGKKVLIVEDDTFLHTLLSDKLTELRTQGLEVFPTMNAAEALETARKEHPDLILLDIAIPGQNGFEVLEELRKEDTFKKTPAIFLTNMAQDSDKKRAGELGAVGYFVKANTPLEEISGEIRRILSDAPSQSI